LSKCLKNLSKCQKMSKKFVKMSKKFVKMSKKFVKMSKKFDKITLTVFFLILFYKYFVFYGGVISSYTKVISKLYQLWFGYISYTNLRILSYILFINYFSKKKF